MISLQKAHWNVCLLPRHVRDWDRGTELRFSPAHHAAEGGPGSLPRCEGAGSTSHRGSSLLSFSLSPAPPTSIESLLSSLLETSARRERGSHTSVSDFSAASYNPPWPEAMWNHISSFPKRGSLFFLWTCSVGYHGRSRLTTEKDEHRTGLIFLKQSPHRSCCIPDSGPQNKTKPHVDGMQSAARTAPTMSCGDDGRGHGTSRKGAEGPLRWDSEDRWEECSLFQAGKGRPGPCDERL